MYDGHARRLAAEAASRRGYISINRPHILATRKTHL
jgi:hypothetical protein